MLTLYKREYTQQNIKTHAALTHFLSFFSGFLAHLSRKAQESFSDQNLFVVRRCRRCLCCRQRCRLRYRKLFTFSSSSPEPLGHFQPNLTQNIFWLLSPLLPFEKDTALHLGKLEFPSPMDALCQVWIKFAQLFWRGRFFF